MIPLTPAPPLPTIPLHDRQPGRLNPTPFRSPRPHRPFQRTPRDLQATDLQRTQARQEFIDPFFAAPGWDVDNRAGLAEAYKDVIHEDAIKIGGATKAPDYCFRLGGTRKFFVEAKKPSIGVSNDPGPAYQVRRYAWTSKLPLTPDEIRIVEEATNS